MARRALSCLCPGAACSIATHLLGCRKQWPVKPPFRQHGQHLGLLATTLRQTQVSFSLLPGLLDADGSSRGSHGKDLVDHLRDICWGLHGHRAMPSCDSLCQRHAVLRRRLDLDVVCGVCLDIGAGTACCSGERSCVKMTIFATSPNVLPSADLRLSNRMASKPSVSRTSGIDNVTELSHHKHILTKSDKRDSNTFQCRCLNIHLVVVTGASVGQ